MIPPASSANAGKVPPSAGPVVYVVSVPNFSVTCYSIERVLFWTEIMIRDGFIPEIKELKEAA